MTCSTDIFSRARSLHLRFGTARSNNKALSEVTRLFEGNRIIVGSAEDKAIRAMEQLAKAMDKSKVMPDHTPGSRGEVLKRTPLVERPYPAGPVNGMRQAPQQALAQTHAEAARSLLRGPTKYGPSMDRKDWHKQYKASLCDLAARGWPVWLVRCVAEVWACHSFPHGLPESDADTFVSQAFEIVGIVGCHRTADRHSVDLALSQAERLRSLEHFVRVALEVKWRPWMIRPMIHAEAKFRFGDDIPREDVNGMLDKALNRPT